MEYVGKIYGFYSKSLKRTLGRSRTDGRKLR
jgi:hypothetical protein